MKWAGEGANMGHRRGVYRTVAGNSDGKKPLVRLRCR